MIEYTHTLEKQKKSIWLVIILNYPTKIKLGVAFAIASVLCFILGATLQMDILTVFAVLLLAPAMYAFYFWAKIYRVRTVTMARLFKKHSVTSLTFNFFYKDGVYYDVCKTIAADTTEFKKRDIQKIFYTKETIFIKLYTGSVITLPNQKDIAELLRR